MPDSRFDALLARLRRPAGPRPPVFVPGLGLVEADSADLARQQRAPRAPQAPQVDPQQYRQWMESLQGRPEKPTFWGSLTQTSPETMARASQFASDVTDPNYEGSFSALPPSLRGFVGGATEGLVGTFSNPAGVTALAADALMPGSGRALRGVGHAAQTAASAPIAATGFDQMLDPEASTRERVGGGAMGALGTLGAVLGVSGLQQGQRVRQSQDRLAAIQEALQRRRQGPRALLPAPAGGGDAIPLGPRTPRGLLGTGEPPAQPAAAVAAAPEPSAVPRISEPGGKPYLGPEAQQAMRQYAKATGQDVSELDPWQFADVAPDDPRAWRHIGWGQRKGLQEADAGYQRRLGDDSGAVDPMLLLSHVLSGGAGAAAGAASSDSPLGPLVGAAAGLTLPSLLRKPGLFERVGYGGLLGAPSTIGGGHVGAYSALTGKSAETALTGLLRGDMGEVGRAGRMLGGVISPGARQAYSRALRQGVDNPNDPMRWGPTDPRSPWTIPSRLMAAPDEQVRHAMQRAGETEEAARRAAFTGDPDTGTGKAIVGLQRKLGPFARTLAFPFAKTVTNVAERGIERTPGLGFIADALAQSRTARKAGQAVPDLATRLGRSVRPDTIAQQALGGAAGAAAYELAPEEGRMPYLTPFVSGPYAVPVGIGVALKQWLAAGADPADLPATLVGAVGQESPLPTQAWQLEQAKDPRKWATRIMPRGATSLPGASVPGDFEQDSLLGPLFARIPYLNEMLLDKRPTARPTRSTRRSSRRTRRR